MRLPLLALLTLAAAGCVFGPNEQREELERARERWAAQGITLYSFTVHRSCFCPMLTVEVTVGEVAVERIDVDTGLPIAEQLIPLYPDVPGLFAIIERELDRPAASLEVEYDPVRGYPTRIVVDPIRNAVDDEYSYLVTELEPAG
ncbi:MAG: DUF6174 domain-containing protein [Gemmatimonadales bacterium]